MNTIGNLIRDKRKRKGWSQTVLGDFVSMSTATIHRIEYGEKLPTDDELQLLASALSLELDILQNACEETRQTRQSSKLPAMAYKSDWEFAHPSTYAGRVWIQLTPLPENRAKNHELTIRWGAWEYTDNLMFGESQSICLLHYKHNDGEGLPIVLKANYPCYVVFGKETAPSTKQIDIILNWKRVEPYSLQRLWRMTLSHLWVRLIQQRKSY